MKFRTASTPHSRQHGAGERISAPHRIAPHCLCRAAGYLDCAPAPHRHVQTVRCGRVQAKRPAPHCLCCAAPRDTQTALPHRTSRAALVKCSREYLPSRRTAGHIHSRAVLSGGPPPRGTCSTRFCWHFAGLGHAAAMHHPPALLGC